ncbi:hypothetical protein FOA52_010356 [Chlamydomonas sp. UWO 241]|nr:hypothetical protein FOA52_010356 [Chlamydomonas sp. UWO 241]
MHAQALSTSNSAPSSSSQQDVAHSSSFVYTRFHWPVSLGGSEVQVWGSFNNWAKGIKLHRFEDTSADAFSVVMPLRPGCYEYKYVVDGSWQTAPFEQTVSPSEGSLNNFRVVAPTIEFSIHAPDAEQVLVVGDWDGWQYSLLMVKDAASGTFSAQVHLKPGQYSYYYVVDDEVVLNPDEQYEVDAERGAVHKDWSYLPDVFRLFYCTGWEDTVMHYRRVRPGVEPPTEFHELRMTVPSNRVCELGTWKLATIVPSVEGEVVQFYLSNGLTGSKGAEDKPSGGGLYRMPTPSPFKLTFGRLRPFPRGGDERIMVVSDLDGTMFGDVNCHDAFDSSTRFRGYWENSQALAGSVLVYNTGRSLGQFTGLLKNCDGRVAVPDVLVTAVGTKVWKRNLQLSDRFGLLEAVPPEGADAQAEYDAMAAAIREVATNHLAPRGSRRRRGWQFTLSQRTLRLMDARQRAHTAWLRSKSAAAKRERNRANRAADAAVQRDRERWIGQQVAEAQDMLRKKNLRQFARACDRLAGRSRSHQIPPAMRDVSGALHSGPDGVLKAMTESFDKLYGGETKLSDETLNQLENDVAAFELTRATEVDEAHGRPPDLAETEACVRALRSAAAPGG